MGAQKKSRGGEEDVVTSCWQQEHSCATRARVRLRHWKGSVATERETVIRPSSSEATMHSPCTPACTTRLLLLLLGQIVRVLGGERGEGGGGGGRK